jgi:hypothetical protein
MQKRRIKVPSAYAEGLANSRATEISFDEWNDRYTRTAPRKPSRALKVAGYIGSALVYLFTKLIVAVKAFFRGVAWCFANIHQLMITAFMLWIMLLLYITCHVTLKAQGYL